MKCPKCNGKGKVLDYVAERNCHGEWETVLREMSCDKCQRKRMTEEEYLRSCSTEELASWLLGFAFNFCFTMNEEEDKKNAIRYLMEMHE